MTEKSNLDRIKDVVYYAPLGIFTFLKENGPAFISMFASRGKIDAVKTSSNIKSDAVEDENLVQGPRSKAVSAIKDNALMKDLSRDYKKRESILYSAVGALGFVKENAGNFGGMFTARGQQDVQASKAVAKEKIVSKVPSTKKKTEEDLSNETLENSSSDSVVNRVENLALGAVSLGGAYVKKSCNLVSRALSLVATNVGLSATENPEEKPEPNNDE